MLALALGAGLWFAAAQPGGRHRVGLFTTLPILWAEEPDLGELLRNPAPPHWARAALERQGTIVPLDTLAGPDAAHTPLAGVDLLVIAQPRPLGPAENVALDDWVKAGGRLLLLADPALTEESRYALGDPRRPQGVVLLSPILRRWGLELAIDDEQAMGEARREVMGVETPVNLPGRFATRGQANCRLWDEGLTVTCALGKGRVVALADAAVVERDDPDGARSKAFAALLDAAAVGR